MWIDDNDKVMNVLDDVESKNPAHFPTFCPICGKKAAHLYFYKYADDNDKGGMWAWCSSCKHSAHTMFRIPKWWVNLSIIKFEELSSCPDFLERYKNEIDHWINELLNLKQ